MLLQARDRLIAKVPRSHLEFLRRMAWCDDRAVTFAPGRVVCVHAGLDVNRPAELQLAALQRRDPFDPDVLKPGCAGRIMAFSERNFCVPMHPDLDGNALLISGHHGFTKVTGGRFIIDASGGNPDTDAKTIDAVVLPDRTLYDSAGRFRSV